MDDNQSDHKKTMEQPIWNNLLNITQGVIGNLATQFESRIHSK